MLVQQRNLMAHEKYGKMYSRDLLQHIIYTTTPHYSPVKRMSVIMRITEHAETSTQFLLNIKMHFFFACL